LDLVTLAGSLFGIAGTILVVYLLRGQKGKIIVGVGGSLLLLSLTVLGIAYGLISGVAVWFPTGLALILLVFFSYLALRRPQSAQSSFSQTS
jgi:lipoprotein signal peptidase